MFLENNLVSVLSVTVLAGATVATSVIGITRVGGSYSQNKLAVPDDRTVSSSSMAVSINTEAVTPTGTASAQAVHLPRPSPSASSSSASSVHSAQITPTGTASMVKQPGKALGKEKYAPRNQDQTEEDRVHAE